MAGECRDFLEKRFILRARTWPNRTRRKPPGTRTSVRSGSPFAYGSGLALTTSARPSVYLHKTIVGNLSLSHLALFPVCFRLTRFSHYSRRRSPTTFVVASTRLLAMKSVVSLEISVLSISKRIQIGGGTRRPELPPDFRKITNLYLKSIDHVGQ